MIKPTFAAAWAASQRIYNRTGSAELVAHVIGGRVADYIRDKKNPWQNTCAVRMSYILNQCGMPIPRLPQNTKPGGDLRNYFFKVRDVFHFLKSRWGAPEIVAFPASGNSVLIGKKGIILFEVSGWRDATGHATLFDGTGCYDQCFFNESGAKYTTTKANFWELK